MNTTIRRIAVSGSAAVALLGGAAVISVATADTATAETQSVVERAVTAPVTLPDGRTFRITGMGGYGHQATAEHVATVASLKTDTTPSADPGIGTGLTPDNGTGSGLQNPLNQQQVPASTNEQIQTQAGAGTIATGIVAILILGIVVFFLIKHGHVKAFHAVVLTLFGIAISSTVFGTMGDQMTNSLVGSLASMLGGMG